jgi:hypothetical protein
VLGLIQAPVHVIVVSVFEMVWEKPALHHSRQDPIIRRKKVFFIYKVYLDNST